MLMIYLKFTLLTTMVLAFSTENSISDVEFYELEKYANIASVAYCMSKGLSLGPIGEQGPRCPSVACQHSYVSKLQIMQTFNFDGLFEVGSGFLAIDRESQTIYLGFRGTSSTQDWLNNLSALPSMYHPLSSSSGEFVTTEDRKCNNCKVHKGIGSFLKSNGAVVLRSVLKLKKSLPDYRIVLTGHSLGAAISLLTAIELRLMGHDALVVTLAGPKIGDKNFADFVDCLFETSSASDWIQSKESFDSLRNGLIRMVHKNDIVPYLPPTNFYQHSGYEYYLCAEGLQQTSETVKRLGTNYIEDQPIGYLEIIPRFRRLDHSSYFLAVSHCI